MSLQASTSQTVGPFFVIGCTWLNRNEIASDVLPDILLIIELILMAINLFLTPPGDLQSHPHALLSADTEQASRPKFSGIRQNSNGRRREISLYHG